MNFIKYLIIGLLFIVSNTTLANDFPLQVSEIFSKNQITKYKGQKLILLDFWATWCGTCKPATQQLEVIQEELNKEIFIISVTNETHQKVANYTQRIPIKLMVVCDTDGNLIDKYAINRRPQAVLLNTSGQILWKGHPADLSRNKIKWFARKNRNTPLISLNEILQEEKNNVKDDSEEIVRNAFQTEISDLELKLKRSSATQTIFEKDENKVKYIGSFFYLLAKLYKIPNHLVRSETILDFPVELETSKYLWDNEPNKIVDLARKNLAISINSKNRIEDVYIFEIKNKNKLWNKNQFSLEDTDENFIVKKNRIIADDMTIADFALLLSNSQKRVFLFLDDDDLLYDWDLHLQPNSSIKEELLSKYGIKIQRKKINVETVNVSF